MTDGIDRDEIKDSNRLEALQDEDIEESEDDDQHHLVDEYDIAERESSDPVTDETDWLLQELLTYQETVQEDGYSDVEALGNAVVQPDAIEATETVDGSISSSVRSKYTWNSDNSKGGIREEDDGLFKWIYDFRLKESDVEGEDVLKQNEDLKILDSIIEGHNALKWQERAKIHGSVLQGDNLLQQSEDVEITGSTLYGGQTLHYVDDVRLVDSFVVGEDPMAYSLGENDGRIELYNTVVMGDSVLSEQRNVAVTDSVLVGDEVLGNGKARLKNSYIIEDGTVEFYEDGKVKGYSSRDSDPDETWEL